MTAEFITYRVVWWAEVGQVDGFGIGRWDATTWSTGFDSKEEAEAALMKKEGTLDRHGPSYKARRIRREEIPV